MNVVFLLRYELKLILNSQVYISEPKEHITQSSPLVIWEIWKSSTLHHFIFISEMMFCPLLSFGASAASHQLTLLSIHSLPDRTPVWWHVWFKSSCFCWLLPAGCFLYLHSLSLRLWSSRPLSVISEILPGSSGSWKCPYNLSLRSLLTSSRP